MNRRLAAVVVLAVQAAHARALPVLPGHGPGAAPVAAPATCTGYVALTFDDGPTAVTRELLAVLSRRRVQAVFFNLGSQELRWPEVVREMAAAGHQLGSHGWDHADLRELPIAEVVERLERSRAVHEAIAPPFEFFRPPYGSTSGDVRAAALGLGMTEALWTVDSKDFAAESVEQIVERSKGLQDGGNVLLHDGKPLTLAALDRIIDHYHAAGFCFGKLAAGPHERHPRESPALTFLASAVAAGAATPPRH